MLQLQVKLHFTLKRQCHLGNHIVCATANLHFAFIQEAFSTGLVLLTCQSFVCHLPSYKTSPASKADLGFSADEIDFTRAPLRRTSHRGSDESYGLG